MLQQAGRRQVSIWLPDQPPAAAGSSTSVPLPHCILVLPYCCCCKCMEHAHAPYHNTTQYITCSSSMHNHCPLPNNLTFQHATAPLFARLSTAHGHLLLETWSQRSAFSMHSSQLALPQRPANEQASDPAQCPTTAIGLHGFWPIFTEKP